MKNAYFKCTNYFTKPDDNPKHGNLNMSQCTMQNMYLRCCKPYFFALCLLLLHKSEAGISIKEAGPVKGCLADNQTHWQFSPESNKSWFKTLLLQIRIQTQNVKPPACPLCWLLCSKWFSWCTRIFNVCSMIDYIEIQSKEFRTCFEKSGDGKRITYLAFLSFPVK